MSSHHRDNYPHGGRQARPNIGKPTELDSQRGIKPGELKSVAQVRAERGADWDPLKSKKKPPSTLAKIIDFFRGEDKPGQVAGRRRSLRLSVRSLSRPGLFRRRSTNAAAKMHSWWEDFINPPHTQDHHYRARSKPRRVASMSTPQRRPSLTRHGSSRRSPKAHGDHPGRRRVRRSATHDEARREHVRSSHNNPGHRSRETRDDGGRSYRHGPRERRGSYERRRPRERHRHGERRGSYERIRPQNSHPLDGQIYYDEFANMYRCLEVQETPSVRKAKIQNDESRERYRSQHGKIDQIGDSEARRRKEVSNDAASVVTAWPRATCFEEQGKRQKSERQQQQQQQRHRRHSPSPPIPAQSGSYSRSKPFEPRDVTQSASRPNCNGGSPFISPLHRSSSFYPDAAVQAADIPTVLNPRPATSSIPPPQTRWAPMPNRNNSNSNRPPIQNGGKSGSSLQSIHDSRVGHPSALQKQPPPLQSRQHVPRSAASSVYSVHDQTMQQSYVSPRLGAEWAAAMQKAASPVSPPSLESRSSSSNNAITRMTTASQWTNDWNYDGQTRILADLPDVPPVPPVPPLPNMKDPRAGKNGATMANADLMVRMTRLQATSFDNAVDERARKEELRKLEEAFDQQLQRFSMETEQGERAS